MSFENKVIARRYFHEIMNQANWDTLHEILAPEFVFSLPTHPEPYFGPDGFKELVTMLHDAFPEDFYVNIQEMVADGDTVVTRWFGSGTHKGGSLHTTEGDIAASGKHFGIDGITWHVIKDGQIVESTVNEDTLGLFMQLGVIPAPPSELEQTTPEENRELVARYFGEIMSEGNLDIVEEVLHPDFRFIIPTQPEPIAGYEDFKGFVQYLHNAFPDIQFTVLREIAEDNKVASRWRINATHKGEFLGQSATGNAVEDFGIDIFRISDGKILTVHVNENDMGLMKQMGMFDEQPQ
mgnify:CR=1 FL=1